MIRAMLRRRADEDRQAGITMVVVVGLTAVMLIALATALTGATSGLRLAAQTQSSTRALDAAYAGVQEYIARLNADATYAQYRNPAAAFSSQSTGALPTGAQSNPAFSVDTSATGGTWATVPGSSSGATFRYEVDNSLYGANGVLRLRSTGRSGTSTRTVVATIRQQGLIDYMYFADYFTLDPAVTRSSSTCTSYVWSTPARSEADCPRLLFGPDDILDGPSRFNDTVTVCGTTFNGPITTSNPNPPLVQVYDGCAQPTYNAGQPQYAPVLAMPATNTAMQAQTYADTADNPGCLYTGPTRITLNGNGTMTVVSPWTKATSVKSTGVAATILAPARCGALSDLHSTAGATIPVLANNLLFVQSVPTNTSDPNYTATTTVPKASTVGSWNAGTTYTCTGANAAAITGSAGSAGWTFTDSAGTIRYPLSGESPVKHWDNTSNSALWDTTRPAYGCRSGDVYVKGTLQGKMTIASDNYVYAAGDILYSSRANDMLGLVGNNGVLVYNPMQNSTSMLGDNGREIDAAIASPAHTFQVQNEEVGSNRGRLTILGSIAQRFTGTTAGWSGSGYKDHYIYDTRLLNLTPPYYLKPTSTGFRVGSYASVDPAFTSTGAAN